MADDLFVGTEPCTFDFEGSPVFIGPGTVVRAGHPILKGREGLFKPLVVHFDVETRAEKAEAKAEAKATEKAAAPEPEKPAEKATEKRLHTR